MKPSHIPQDIIVTPSTRLRLDASTTKPAFKYVHFAYSKEFEQATGSKNAACHYNWRALLRASLSKPTMILPSTSKTGTPFWPDFRIISRAALESAATF